MLLEPQVIVVGVGSAIAAQRSIEHPESLQRDGLPLRHGLPDVESDARGVERALLEPAIQIGGRDPLQRLPGKVAADPFIGLPTFPDRGGDGAKDVLHHAAEDACRGGQRHQGEVLPGQRGGHASVLHAHLDAHRAGHGLRIA